MSVANKRTILRRIDMEIKEAINAIKENKPTSGYTILCEALDMAVSALEKQIPKKPDLEGDGYDENGELIYDTGYCPNCRHIFENGRFAVVYIDKSKWNCCPLIDITEQFYNTEKAEERIKALGGAQDA